MVSKGPHIYTYMNWNSLNFSLILESFLVHFDCSYMYYNYYNFYCLAFDWRSGIWCIALIRFVLRMECKTVSCMHYVIHLLYFIFIFLYTFIFLLYISSVSLMRLHSIGSIIFIYAIYLAAVSIVFCKKCYFIRYTNKRILNNTNFTYPTTEKSWQSFKCAGAEISLNNFYRTPIWKKHYITYVINCIAYYQYDMAGSIM